MTNKLKQVWANGRGTINGWCSIGSPTIAELMAAQGYDSVTIDLQHGALDYRDALTMLQAMRGSDVVPMVRVPWNEPGIIMKALDAGAYGVIVPMVNTAAQAKAMADAVRYPPLGQRSFGPTRVSIGAGPGYMASANETLVALAMIETAEAVSNVDEIVATPGIDGVYIGPADLTLSVTNARLAPGFDREETEIVEVIQAILAAAKRAGKVAALHCGSAQYAAKAIEWGFDMTTVSGDTRLLATSANASVAEWRGLVGD